MNYSKVKQFIIHGTVFIDIIIIDIICESIFFPKI